MRANTVFGSKLKLKRFVMLLWNFTERGKSYQQISNAANLPPQAHYVEDKLSPNSIAKWNKYFRYLCKEDYLKNKVKVGGKGRIVEIDETMCQSCKIFKHIRWEKNYQNLLQKFRTCIFHFFTGLNIAAKSMM